MNISTHTDHGPADHGDIAAALRAMPQETAPSGNWKRALDRYHDEQQRHSRRRRVWGSGMAIAAGVAVAVVGLRLGGGMFSVDPANQDSSNPGPDGTAAMESAALVNSVDGLAVDLGQQLERMDMAALIAFSQLQEQRLRALPLVELAGPGQVVEVGSFGIKTEIEDQIALLDEGWIPASLNANDQAVPRRLLQERALLMEDLFELRRVEAAQAGYMYADF